jgi:hypothetical protein
MSKASINPRETTKRISLSLKVASISNNSLALLNQIFLNPQDAKVFASHNSDHALLPQSNYVKVKDWVYIYGYDSGFCY